MSTTTKNRRAQTRYSVLSQKEARVEFVFPFPHGKAFRLPLTNSTPHGSAARSAIP